MMENNIYSRTVQQNSTAEHLNFSSHLRHLRRKELDVPLPLTKTNNNETWT
jgi:hypothetical protein